MNSPVLLIIFNRLDTVQRVFSRIREARPPQLFIAADGPRLQKEGETEKCAAVRKWVIENIDWECETRTLFRENNVGCGRGPADAITWFFEHVEKGIILEDDCLPEKSFFLFCDELLERYKDNEQIMLIGGTKPLVSIKKKEDYFFSRYGTTWGWASWRRAWSKFDYDIKIWQDDSIKNRVMSNFESEEEKKYFKKIFDQTYNKINVSWWDYQWMFARLANNGLAILPTKNQIRNIGFGADATHTFDKDLPESKNKSYTLSFPLNHPQAIDVDHSFDRKMLFPKPSFIDKVRYKVYKLLAR